jgi:putative phosphoribosyl transferase
VRVRRACVPGAVTMFDSRADAGRRLAARLQPFHDDGVVLGLPCGGVLVAAEVARVLDLPFGLIMVRKLGVPGEPDLAMGAIGEGGVRVINHDIVRHRGVDQSELAAAEIRERHELDRRVRLFGAVCPRVPLAGRVAIIVDDGIATGATSKVACTVARNRSARKIVLAVPVGPHGVRRLLEDAADELVCARVAWPFLGIGQEYRDFAKVSDWEVLDCLAHTPVPSAGRARNTTPDGEHGRQQQRLRAAGHDEDRSLLQRHRYG